MLIRAYIYGGFLLVDCESTQSTAGGQKCPTPTGDSPKGHCFPRIHAERQGDTGVGLALH